MFQRNYKLIPPILIICLIGVMTSITGCSNPISKTGHMEADDITLINETSSVFMKGDGTSDNPYQISTPEQLNAVRNNRESHYIQINDIDLSGYGNWKPIGGMDELYFKGNYDGNGYTISNLSIRIQKKSEMFDFSGGGIYIGLFGDAHDSSIKNVNMENVNIDIVISGFDTPKSSSDVLNSSANMFVGSLAGHGGLIEKCTSSGFINVKSKRRMHIGGIAGANQQASITDSINYINITATLLPTSYEANRELYCGGIVGWAPDTELLRDFNKGSVQGSSNNYIHAGGISGKFGMIDKCINYADISGQATQCNGHSSFAYHSNVGGIVGSNKQYVQNCVNYGKINSYAEGSASEGSSTSAAGGIVGFSESTIQASYNLASSINSYRKTELDSEKERAYALAICGRHYRSSTNLIDNYTIPCKINGNNTYSQIEEKALTKKDVEQMVSKIDFGSALPA